MVLGVLFAVLAVAWAVLYVLRLRGHEKAFGGPTWLALVLALMFALLAVVRLA